MRNYALLENTVMAIYTHQMGKVQVSAKPIYQDDGAVRYDISHDGTVVATATRSGERSAFEINSAKLGIRGQTAARMRHNGGVLFIVCRAILGKGKEQPTAGQPAPELRQVG